MRLTDSLGLGPNWPRLDHLRLALWIAVVVCVAVGFICVRFHAPSFIPLLGHDDWLTAPGFLENPGPAPDDMDASIRENSQARFFWSWKLSGGPATGTLESRHFNAPKILVVPYAGYPIEAGVHLALRCVESTREMPIATGNAHEYWVQRILEVPSSFCAGPVQIVASNTSDRFYISVGTPFAGSRWHLLKYSVFSLVYILALTFALMVVPIVALSALARRLGVSPTNEWLWATAIFGLFAYATFFLVQANKFSAIVISIAFYSLCLIGCAGTAIARRHIPKGLETKGTRPPWRIPMLFAFSLFALLFLEMVDIGAGTWNAAYRFIPAVWSSDHIWPRIVADGLWAGLPAPQIFTGWHVSDRPPLMAGFLLLMRPVADALGPGAAAPGMTHLMPKAAGIIANAAITLPIVELMASSAAARKRPHWIVLIAILLIVMSPFIIFNVIYTWPKLMSAFFALAATMVIAEDGKARLWSRVSLAGILFGLGLLSHAGVALGLLAVPFGVRILSGNWRLRQTMAAGFVSALCWLPWSYWQKHVDPPGNALIKFALTGSYGFDDQQTTVADTVRRFLAHITWQQWLESKWLALKTLFGYNYQVFWLDVYVTTRLGGWRLRDFLFVVPTLRFLGIGLVFAGLVALWRRRLGAATKPMVLWFACGLAGIAINVILTWSDHVTFTQSYFTFVALLLACGFAILELPTPVAISVAIAQALYVAAVWVVDPIWIHSAIALTAVGAILALFLLCIEMAKLSSGFRLLPRGESKIIPRDSALTANQNLMDGEP